MYDIKSCMFSILSKSEKVLFFYYEMSYIRVRNSSVSSLNTRGPYGTLLLLLMYLNIFSRCFLSYTLCSSTLFLAQN